MGDARALLFTDVVDSTLLAERIGDTASAALWVAHDRAARDLLPRWHGREIEKTDGLLVLFERPDDAVGYALDYHAALARLTPPLKARAGLHVAPVTLRENSAHDVALGAKPVEVEGLAKSIAARAMAVALGGQTLLTADARHALASGQAQTRLQSHGHWRFKGIAEPIELYEAGDIGPDRPAAPLTPPPDAAKAYRVVRQNGLWLPARRIKQSLPAERDDFVGRHDSLIELARRFDAGARLVSVLGMGGSGKTRLVTRWAWTWLGDFPGGAWFCDLSQARSLDGIVHAVAQALEVPLGRDDPVLQLGHAIAGRGACLLILDNFEQVARLADATLGRWLDRAADARFLVTSREVLGLPGEEVLALPPLLPDDAAALFVRRAASAQADFNLAAQDQAAILPLVKLLDGLPLAIELAAARVRVLTPTKLLARMSERFQILASSGKRHDRPATLRATFDWSWELLAPPERAALAQLSVFEGGFTLEAAEAVFDLAAFDAAPWPTDVLQSLVDKSFVRQLSNGRFDLLVSMQEYAAEHLRTPAHFPGSGPVALAAAQHRHVAFFASLGQQRAMADGCADVSNLVAACRRAATARHIELAFGALEGAWAALKLRGPFRAGVELAGLVRDMPGLTPQVRARVEYIAGAALHATGDRIHARARFEASLDLARTSGDARAETLALIELGELLTSDGQAVRGRGLHERALQLARSLSDHSLECAAHNGLGTSSTDLGQIDDAHAHYEAALECARAARDLRWEGGVLGNLGQVHAMQGRLHDARIHFEAGLAIAGDLGDRGWLGSARCNLGLLHQVLGNHAEAQVHLDAALQLARELGHTRLECIALCNLGIVEENLGRFEVALERLEGSIRVARQLGDRRNEGQFLNHLAQLHARQGRFEAARNCLGEGERLLVAVDDRFSLGLLLCSRAEVEFLASAWPAARRALAQADAIARDIGAAAGSELGVALRRASELLAARCGTQ
jgi:predicted ATPase/tetratricopeptide (TPR) repeat protein